MKVNKALTHHNVKPEENPVRPRISPTISWYAEHSPPRLFPQMVECTKLHLTADAVHSRSRAGVAKILQWWLVHYVTKRQLCSFSFGSHRTFFTISTLS